MKFITWIALAAFCAAFGQTPMVESRVQARHADCCCHSKCGMPECAPVPQRTSESLATAVEPATRPASRKRAQRRAAPTWVASLDTASRNRRSASAPVRSEGVVSPVRLFEAHCAFLI
ncbi:MAG TPA: hypothetical protein VHD32_13010 [Candidatus Didemnitutus sp.]|nr:hypothetical protein [Candidatus Didemnitutus sp.]